MELNLQRQSITVSEVIYNGDAEQPVECDVLLPDYYPDIVKILKCTITTAISSSSASGDRLAIEGISTAHVYYSSTGDSIRHADYKIPFSKTIDLKTTPENPIITVTPKTDYVNCRAVSQRRIDIRGAVSLAVKASHSKNESIISNAEGVGLQLRRSVINVTEITGRNVFSFPIREDLECGYGKPAIGNIIRTECKVNVINHKLVSDKILLKAEALLHISYQPVESSELEIMKYNLPISQILDCSGIDESSICDIIVSTAGCDISAKTDEAGEYRLFAVDAMLEAGITAHRHADIPITTDCYSTKFESKGIMKPVTFTRLAEIIRTNVLHKTDMDLPDEIDTILDTWCEIDSVSRSMENNELLINICVQVNLMAKMPDGECRFFDRTTEFTHKISTSCTSAGADFSPVCDIVSCDYSLQGNDKIDIRCEVSIGGCLYCRSVHNSLSDVSIDEESPKTAGKNKLILYYAAEGESIWDIAKHYNTSSDAISAENQLESNHLSYKQMLLIPIV